MHALLITFNPQVSQDEFMKQTGHMLEGMRKAEGLIMKTFVAPDERTWGGFYIFESPEAAKGYVESAVFKEFSSNSALANVNVQHLMVMDEPSHAFGTPSTPLAARA